MSQEEEVGKVVGYFKKIGVAAVEVTAGFGIGDTLRFRGTTTDFTVTVDSLQVDNKPVEKTSPGEKVGLKVGEKVRDADRVYKVTG